MYVFFSPLDSEKTSWVTAHFPFKPPLPCTSAPASLSCWILSLLGTTAAFLFHWVTTWFIWRLIFPVTAVMSSSCAFLPTDSIWTKFQKQNVAVVQLSTCIFPPPWKGLVKPWKRGAVCVQQPSSVAVSPPLFPSPLCSPSALCLGVWTVLFPQDGFTKPFSSC